jgi:hypothetical protein
MKVTDLTREILRCRRERRRLLKNGWEEISQNGGRLWELHSGYRQRHRIVAVCIGPDGKSVWIKTQETQPLKFG